MESRTGKPRLQLLLEDRADRIRLEGILLIMLYLIIALAAWYAPLQVLFDAAFANRCKGFILARAKNAAISQMHPPVVLLDKLNSL